VELTSVTADLAAESEAQDSSPNKDLAGRSTVAMQLNGSGVNFKIDTAVDHSIAIVSLTAKLELALQMLSETSHRLDLSMVRIGQLEAELAASREEVCVNSIAEV